MIGLVLVALAGCAAVQTPQDKLASAVAEAAKQTAPDYKHALVDLNGDGVQDAIVLLRGMQWCGSGGCTMLVLAAQDDGFSVVSRSTVTSPPVRVSRSGADGWRDIIVHSAGKARLMRFGGDSYPANPSMQPDVPDTQAKFADIVIP